MNKQQLWEALQGAECSSCFFYRKDKYNRMVCRKNPPTMVDTLWISNQTGNRYSAGAYQPEVDEEDWCGSFAKC